MTKDAILKLVESTNNLTLTKENTTEIMINFHEIKMKVHEFFPDEGILLNRIIKVERRELNDYKIKHNLYLKGKVEIEQLSSLFASLKLAIKSDIYFTN